MDTSLPIGQSFAIFERGYICYHCRRQFSGYAVPSFIFVLSGLIIPRKGTEGFQCESCGNIICNECTRRRVTKSAIEELGSGQCPICNATFGPSYVILDRGTSVRASGSFSKAWTKVRRGRIRKEFSDSSVADLIVSLVFAFLIGGAALLGMSLVAPHVQTWSLTGGDLAVISLALLLLLIAILQVVPLAWYFIFLPPWMQFLCATSDITFGVFALLISLLAIDAHVGIIFPFGFILIPVGFFRLFQYSKLKRRVYFLQDQLARLDANVYFNSGNARLNEGELDMAIADFDRALEINPQLADVYNNRGNAYRRKGELDRAVADYDRALELDLELAEVYNGRGLVYYARGEFDRAIAEYNRAIEISPQKAEPYNNRGLANADKGEFGRALADYRRAIGINPRYAGAYYNRANAHLNEGELDQAIVDYDRAIEISPRFAEAYYNRANAHFNEGALDQAIADYSRALEINPRFAEAYSNRGNARLNKGELDQAIADYDRAIEISPQFAEAYYNRGTARFKKGEPDLAITDYDRALKINPRFPRPWC